MERMIAMKRFEIVEIRDEWKCNSKTKKELSAGGHGKG